jgi:hypothetical protein
MTPADMLKAARWVLDSDLTERGKAELLHALRLTGAEDRGEAMASDGSATAPAAEAPRSPAKVRSPGAERQRRWRERLAASRSRLGDAGHETPRDGSETGPDRRARSLESLSSLGGSGSEIQNPPTTFGGGPPRVDGDGETPRDETHETPRDETRCQDAWTLTAPGVDPPTTPSPPKRGTKPDREARGTRCPRSTADAFDVAAWLTGHGIPDASDPEVVKFLDYHRAKGTRSLDWSASWRTWARNAERFGAMARTKPRVQGDGSQIGAIVARHAARAATPQNTVTPEYLERETKAQAARRAELEALDAAERARPPWERDPFGPDWEPRPDDDDEPPPVAAGDGRG